MADYPDYTELIQIIGSDIMVPIDLQAAYIMMPVDIQAQYITLDIDIVAQSVGNISVDIAAQTIGAIDVDITAQTLGSVDVDIKSAITLNVDITAQTLGEVKIDIDAQSVALIFHSEWEVIEGNAIDFYAAGAHQGTDAIITDDLIIASGQVLYIWGFGGSCYGDANEDKDKDQFCQVWLGNDGTSILMFGGNGGVSIALAQPIKYVYGDVFEVNIKNVTGHDCNMVVTAYGYYLSP